MKTYTIRRLEWVQGDIFGTNVLFARTAIGEYQCWEGGPCYLPLTPGSARIITEASSYEEQKAAAQRDYEERLARLCLEPTPDIAKDSTGQEG